MMKGRFILKNNIKRLILIVVLVLFVSLFTTYKISSKSEIDKILETTSYSYLPKEAKYFIKEVYEETGQVVLTEKNKKDNQPYLNSQYISYLKLSDEEKENVGYIPNVYTFDYMIDNSYKPNNLSSQFILSDYVTETRNQGTMGICWAIASVENVETYLMWKNKTPYNANSKTFSARQFDYATSTDGMYYKVGTSNTQYLWNNSRYGYRPLTSGGNFYMAAVAMASGITLTDKSVIPFSESVVRLKPEAVLNHSNSEYEVNSTVQLPMINSDSASTSEISSYVAMVKNYINEYGGLFIGTYSPQSTCGFKNTDGTYAMKTDDCVSVNADEGHAMQLIGWDDDYDYAYCDNGTTHTSYNGSCSGTKKTGKGAWILRNSWGDATDYKYVYLTYDSTRLIISTVTDVSKKSDSNWDNIYHANIVSDEKLHTANTQTLSVNKRVENIEKIEKFKFHPFTQNGSYTLKIKSDDIDYSKDFVVDEVGIYTIDLSDKNLFIDDSTLTFSITGNNNSIYIYNSGTLFTSNVDDDAMLKVVAGTGTKQEDNDIPGSSNPIYIEGNSGSMSLQYFTKNIPAGSNISFRILNSKGEDYTNYLFNSNQLNKVVLDDLIYFSPGVKSGSEESASKPICGENFDLQILYNDVVLDTIPIKRICNSKNTKSTINFHANDGSGYVFSLLKDDLYSMQLMKSDGRGNENFGAYKNFFRNDKHIVGWNTKSNGSGTQYRDNIFLVYTNSDLYAQWGDTHSYKVNYQCAKNVCNANSISSKETTKFYGSEFDIEANTFTNLKNDAFLYWVDENNNIYYPEETVVDIVSKNSPYNNDEYNNLNSVWASNYKTITFNSNGGRGSMSSINVATSVDSRLKYNKFSHDNRSFVEWNTKADGTGTRYMDGQVINISENITLYAQWENTKYNVRFSSNGGEGSMDIQEFEHSIYENLNENKFSRIGYTFKGWNTKADGSGISYFDKQSVVDVTQNVGTVTLYAMWEANTYTVIFNSNGGEGEMNSQSFKYDEEKSLSSNTFTKEGLVFSDWNTKADGTGVSYANKQKVKNLTTGTTIRLYAQWSERTYEIDKYKVDDNINMIESIRVNTTIDEFKENIKLGSGYKVEVDSKIVEGKMILYTGGKTKIYKSSNLIAEYTNVVLGDVNGDGEINSADLFRIRQYLLNIIELNDEYFLASDVNSDTEINSADLFRTRQHLLGIISIG